MEKTIFKQDLPISNLNEDVYNREDFFKKLSDEIGKISFDSSKGFSVGINSTWGSGKSSLLAILQQQLCKQNGNVCIEYNPWLATDRSSLTNDFFSAMEATLSEFIETSDSLVKYARKVSKVDDDHNPFKKFSSFIENEKSLKDQFDTITSLIKSTQRNYFVIIDDLDRLGTEELFDVLRLVRNTANFPNIIFIVAYDKPYLINAIKNLKIHNADIYLEKIFDLEIHLPKIETHIIQEELFAELKKGFEKLDFDFNHQYEYKRQIEELIFNKSKSQSKKFVVPAEAVLKIFKGKRDIYKFCNSFLLLFSIQRNQVSLPDLFILELIKFKRSDLFNHLANADSYLEFDYRGHLRVYHLRYDLDENRTSENWFLKLKNHIQDGQSEEKIYYRLIEALFEMPPNLFKSENSIGFVDSFESYFVIGNPSNVFPSLWLSHMLTNEKWDVSNSRPNHSYLDEAIRVGSDYSLIEKMSRITDTIGSDVKIECYYKILLFLIEKSEYRATVSSLLTQKLFEDKMFLNALTMQNPASTYGEECLKLIKRSAINPYVNIAKVIGDLIITIIQSEGGENAKLITNVASSSQLLAVNEHLLHEAKKKRLTLKVCQSLYIQCIEKVENNALVLSVSANKMMREIILDGSNLSKYLSDFIRPYQTQSNPKLYIPSPFWEQIFGTQSEFEKLLKTQAYTGNLDNGMVDDILRFIRLYLRTNQPITIQKFDFKSSAHDFLNSITS